MGGGSGVMYSDETFTSDDRTYAHSAKESNIGVAARTVLRPRSRRADQRCPWVSAIMVANPVWFLLTVRQKSSRGQGAHETPDPNLARCRKSRACAA